MGLYCAAAAAGSAHFGGAVHSALGRDCGHGAGSFPGIFTGAVTQPHRPGALPVVSLGYEGPFDLGDSGFDSAHAGFLFALESQFRSQIAAALKREPLPWLQTAPTVNVQVECL